MHQGVVRRVAPPGHALTSAGDTVPATPRTIDPAVVADARARRDAWRATLPPRPTHCPRCGLTLADGAGAGRVCRPSPTVEVDPRTGHASTVVHYCEID